MSWWVIALIVYVGLDVLTSLIIAVALGVKGMRWLSFLLKRLFSRTPRFEYWDEY